MMSEDCLFCKIINQEVPSKVIYENELVLAFLDVNPVANGHCLIIPKEHFENLGQTKQPYLDAVSQAKQVVGQMIQTKLQPKGFNYLSNEGEIAGQKVFHYHEHVIPKYVTGEGFNLNDKAKMVNLKTLDEVYQELMK